MTIIRHHTQSTAAPICYSNRRPRQHILHGSQTKVITTSSMTDNLDQKLDVPIHDGNIQSISEILQNQDPVIMNNGEDIGYYLNNVHFFKYNNIIISGDLAADKMVTIVFDLLGMPVNTTIDIQLSLSKDSNVTNHPFNIVFRTGKNTWDAGGRPILNHKYFKSSLDGFLYTVTRTSSGFTFSASTVQIGQGAIDIGDGKVEVEDGDPSGEGGGDPSIGTGQAEN